MVGDPAMYALWEDTPFGGDAEHIGTVKRGDLVSTVRIGI